MNYSVDQIATFIAFLAFLHLFFYPTILAISKTSDSAESVMILNIFGGWTFVGWVVALIRAVKAESRKRYKFNGDNFNFSKNNISRDSKIDALIKLTDKNQKTSQLILQKLAEPPKALSFGNQVVALVRGPAVGLIAFSVMSDTGFSEYSSGVFAVIFAIYSFLYPLRKRFVSEPESRNKMEQKLHFLKNTLAEYCRIYIDLIRPDLPNIHALGLMSVDDIRSRAATVKGSPFLLAYLLNHEVSQGHMESIQTSIPGADQSVIFKSKLNSDPDTRAYERIELDIS